MIIERMRAWTASALMLLAAALANGDAVVAADGSGQYKTVQDAVNAAPSNSRIRFVVRIKPGVYREHIVVPHSKPYLIFVGENPKTTILTNDWYASMQGTDGKPLGTFRTSSTSIEADDFTAENLTFENSAGPKGQAVALTVVGDRAVFRNCRFLGWQDTLLAQTGRQYFENSYIEGAVDFIFGGSTAFFENCRIHIKGTGYITAASTPKDQPYGYVFSHCHISGESPEVMTDLGRPWRDYAAVTFLDTEIPETVRPGGWNNWSKPEREKTSRYAEYHSAGTGANADARVPWARQLSDDEAKRITVESVLSGLDGWNPKTGTVRASVKIDSTPQRQSASKAHAYLAASGRGLAYSLDADKWEPLRASFPMIDPSLVQGPDGVFQLVWATGDKGLGYAASKDLIHWSAQKHFDFMAKENAIDVRNPSVFYDAASSQFLITWASTIRDNFFQSYQEEVDDNPRLWYTATRDFEAFSPAKVWFEPGYSVQRAVLLKDGARYALLHQDSRRSMQELRVAFGNSPLGPWGPSSDTFPRTTCPSALRLGDEWLITPAVKFPAEDCFTTMIEVPRSMLDALRADGERVKIALVGDSTVAEAGGWGPGFQASFGPEVEVINFARNGRSSKSFRDEGAWAPALLAKPNYVLIQFGHNDGPGKGPDRETDSSTYYANMARYVDEARAAGATPVLVTSIVRRNLTSEGKVKADSLVPYVEDVRRLAAAKKILLMDLYTLTLAQCERLGPAGCGELDAKTADGSHDTTHLGERGQREVGAIAGREFVRVVLPGQPSADPKTLTANALLPLNRERATFPLPEPANPKLPTVFIIGDSTVRNGRGEGANGLWGWGEPIADFFDPSRINVVNRAIGGLSSRTYLTQGHWDRALALMKPGDFVLMQFGHNDESPVNDPTRARGTLKGTGGENMEIDNLMTGERETIHTYGWYLRRFIADARAKGATAIVCSPVPRKNWRDGRILRSEHGKWAASVARAERVAFVDLNEIIASRYEKLGPDAVARLFPSDNTHTSRAGAELNADSVISGLRALRVNRLAAFANSKRKDKF